MSQISTNITPKYRQETHYNYVQNSGFVVSSFTGKERDSETGFSYFGARYYDSDLMTGWLSVDPLADKYPSLSPYAYCGWNPIKFIDPNGEFKIPIHVEIVSKVIGDNIGCVKTALIKYGTGIYADIFGYFSEKIYLDNIKKEDKLFDQYKTFLSKFNSKYWNPISMGKDLHTIADFYAHSNYVGLYMEYAEKNDISIRKETEIPTFSDVLTNNKYSDFKQILEKNLKTGIYNSLIEDRNSTDPDSHHLMNYDCPESYMGSRDYNGLKGYDIAYSLAKREVNNAIQKQIKKE